MSRAHAVTFTRTDFRIWAAFVAVAFAVFLAACGPLLVSIAQLVLR